VVLNLERVTAVDAAAEAMLTRALTLLADRGHRVVLVGEVLGSGPWEQGREF
jgi:glutaminase